MEVSTGNPFFVGGGNATYGCGEVDMDIAFEVSAECMNGKKYAWEETHLAGEFFDDVGSDDRDFVHKVTIHPEEIPERRWHGEGDVLPFCVWEGVEAIFDPVVSGPFSAGGAESGFTGMGCLKGFVALRADIEVITEETCFTGHDFQDIRNNAEPDKIAVFEVKFPPVSVIEKNVPDFNAGNDFHQVRLYRDLDKFI